MSASDPKKTLPGKPDLWRTAVVALCFGSSNSFADDYSHLDNPGLVRLLEADQSERLAIGERFSGKPLNCLYYQNAAVDHMMPGQDDEPQILFTSVQTTLAGYYLYPNILHVDASGRWMRTPVPYAADGWTHIHRSRDGVHILVAMDNRPESAGWETRFVVSDDGGRTWSYGESIRKYVYFDVIRYFKMDESGTGAAVEHYDGSVGGYEQAGYYVFNTYDWGATWSDARYERTFDATGYVDVLESVVTRRANRRPLADIKLPNFDSC